MQLPSSIAAEASRGDRNILVTQQPRTDEATRWQRSAIGGGRLRGARGFEATCRFVDDMYALSLPSKAAAARFVFDCTLYQTSWASLSQTSSVALRFDHQSGRVGRNRGNVMIGLQAEGSAQVTIGSNSSLISPGDVMVLDHARAFTIDTLSRYVSFNIIAERERLSGLFAEPSAHGLVLKAGSGEAGLIGSQMRSLFAHADGLDMRAADIAIRSIADITSVLIGASMRVSKRGEAHDAALRREKALAYIDSRLSDPAFKPQQFADHLGLSRSSAYRLFGNESGLRGLIIRRRLERARDLMLAPESRGQPLREIAHAVGFQSEAHFSRAFRSRFGLPPRRFAELADRNDPDWIALQARNAGLLIPGDETGSATGSKQQADAETSTKSLRRSRKALG